MKCDELGSAVRLAVPGIDVLDRDAPSLRPELVCVFAPRLPVPPGRVSIVPNVRACRNRDFAAEADIPRCPTVQKLRNGREESKAFVDDRGQIWQIVSLGKCFRIVKGIDLEAQTLLRFLHTKYRHIIKSKELDYLHVPHPFREGTSTR